jgi:hypothetical protein
MEKLTLSTDQVGPLIRAIENAFESYEELNQMLRVKLNKNLGSYAEPAPLPLVIRKLLTFAQNEGWLERLLKEADKYFEPGNPPLRDLVNTIIDDWEAQLPPWFEATKHPTKACFPQGRAMVDRGDLRLCLPKLNTKRKILLIKGPRTSGRTYSYRLIQHFAEKLPDTKATRINLADWANPEDCTPQALTKAVLHSLGMSTDGIDSAYDSSAEPYRRALGLRTWLAGRLRHDCTKYWIVFDSIDHLSYPSETFELIRGLAQQVDEGNPSNVWIVVLGYQKELGTLSDLILEEELQTIQENEIRTFFVDVATQCNVILSEASIDAAVKKVISMLPAGQVERMSKLPGVLDDVATKIMKP